MIFYFERKKKEKNLQRLNQSFDRLLKKMLFSTYKVGGLERSIKSPSISRLQ